MFTGMAGSGHGTYREDSDEPVVVVRDSPHLVGGSLVGGSRRGQELRRLEDKVSTLTSGRAAIGTRFRACLRLLLFPVLCVCRCGGNGLQYGTVTAVATLSLLNRCHVIPTPVLLCQAVLVALRRSGSTTTATGHRTFVSATRSEGDGAAGEAPRRRGQRPVAAARRRGKPSRSRFTSTITRGAAHRAKVWQTNGGCYVGVLRCVLLRPASFKNA